jgi:hypothetical protein
MKYLVSLLSLSACLFTACGTPFFLSESGTETFYDSTTQQEREVALNILQIEDEYSQPRKNLNIRYQIGQQFGHGASPLGQEKQATTDSNGRIPLRCDAPICQLNVTANGYWPYTGPTGSKSVVIALAEKTPEEKNGTAISAELFRINFHTLPEVYKTALQTDKNTGYSTFIVHNETELATVLPVFQGNPQEVVGGSETTLDYGQKMREALSQGKILVGFSNNRQFRYEPMVESTVATENGYYISNNRTVLKTSRGMSGHSYDIEVQVFAFSPKENVTFHIDSGKLTLPLTPSPTTTAP